MSRILDAYDLEPRATSAVLMVVTTAGTFVTASIISVSDHLCPASLLYQICSLTKCVPPKVFPFSQLPRQDSAGALA